MSDVRAWLLGATNATLCTLAAEPEIAGFPFGSLAPFALRGDGTPFVLISAIAQHTRNLARDPRCALFVRDPNAESGKDAQATWRVTVSARGVEDGADSSSARYARAPERATAAHKLRRQLAGDRAVWQRARSARGRRHSGDHWPRLARPVVIEHMNETTRRCVTSSRRAPACNRARANHLVETSGFLLRTGAPEALHYVEFGREVAAREAREVFVELARSSRA